MKAEHVCSHVCACLPLPTGWSAPLLISCFERRTSLGACPASEGQTQPGRCESCGTPAPAAAACTRCYSTWQLLDAQHNAHETKHVSGAPAGSSSCQCPLRHTPAAPRSRPAETAAAAGGQWPHQSSCWLHSLATWLGVNWRGQPRNMLLSVTPLHHSHTHLDEVVNKGRHQGLVRLLLRRALAHHAVDHVAARLAAAQHRRVPARAPAACCCRLHTQGCGHAGHVAHHCQAACACESHLSSVAVAATLSCVRASVYCCVSGL